MRWSLRTRGRLSDSPAHQVRKESCCPTTGSGTRRGNDGTDDGLWDGASGGALAVLTVLTAAWVSLGATSGAIASSCFVTARAVLVSAVLSFLVSPLTQWHAEQSLVLAEPGSVVTRHSSEAFRRISLSALRCVSGVAFGVQGIGFFGRCCVYVTCDSGYMFCIGAWLLLDELHFFSMWMWARILRFSVSVLTHNGEVCSVDASDLNPGRRARTWNSGNYFYDAHVVGSMCDDDGTGQCTGTGPGKSVSETVVAS